MTFKVSTVGQPRREVEFADGETLGGVFDRLGIEVPTGAGVEVWVNGEAMQNYRSYRVQADDSCVMMPSLKGQIAA